MHVVGHGIRHVRMNHIREKTRVVLSGYERSIPGIEQSVWLLDGLSDLP
jgi:hypothetical protein